jgi:hypothetical protein
LLKKTYRFTCGESQLQNLSSKIIELNNTEISRYKIKKFISFLKINPKIILSDKIVKERGESVWGYFFPVYFINRGGRIKMHQRVIVLYRHSVWILLHELSHYLTLHKKKSSPHGVFFHRKLKLLYKKWIEFDK